MYEIEVPIEKTAKEVQIKLIGEKGNNYLYLSKDETYQLAAHLASVIREFEQESKK